MPKIKIDYSGKEEETGMPLDFIPDATLNGNWVVYGIPDYKSNGRWKQNTPLAPKACTTKEDGTSFNYGDEVPLSCCTNGNNASETLFSDRVTEKEGFCSALPRNDKFIGSLTSGPNRGELWPKLRNLAFCHS